MGSQVAEQGGNARTIEVLSQGLFERRVARVKGDITVAANEKLVCGAPIQGDLFSVRQIHLGKRVVGQRQRSSTRRLGGEPSRVRAANRIKVRRTIRREGQRLKAQIDRTNRAEGA